MRAIISAVLLGVALSLSSAVIAQTSGFPSRPKFQAVGVGTAAPTSSGNLKVSAASPSIVLDASTGAGSNQALIQLQSAGTRKGFLSLGQQANQFCLGTSANDLCIGAASGRVRLTTDDGATSYDIGNAVGSAPSLSTVGAGGSATAFKAAATGRTSSSLVADPDLQFALAANALYALTGAINVGDAGGGGGWRAQNGTGPAGATGELTFAGLNASFNDLSLAGSSTYTIGTSGTRTVAVNGYIKTAGTAGTWSLNWGQSVAAGTTTVGVGSWLKLTRLN